MRYRRGLIGSAMFVVGLLALPATAGASLLGNVTAQCAGESLSTPFAQFGDHASYAQMPGGSFEAGAASWGDSGKASVGSGNEPWNVESASDHSSLSLPQGAAATSPAFCVGVTYPTVRFFARSSNALGILRVDAIRTVLGIPVAIPVGVVIATGSSWSPSPAVLTLLNATALVSSSGVTSLQLRLTAELGSWQVDDAFVDPFKGG